MYLFRTAGSRHHDIVVAGGFAVLLLVAAAVGWPALSGPFLFDDFPNLQHLATLQGEVDWRSLGRYASRFEGQPGRPLAMLSFVINDAAWPSEPWSFKYTNLMIHLLVGTLAFGFARVVARLVVLPRDADLAALLVAAAWLLHPMQLSTTMLVVQRMTQLSSLFVIAGLWAYVAIAARARTPAAAMSSIACLGVGTVLAVLCKETGALAPLLAAVINATLLRSRLDEMPALPRRIIVGGVWLPIVALVCAIVWQWDALTWYGTRDFTLVERLLSQPRALLEYLYRIVVPTLHGGGIYHDDFEPSLGLLDPPATSAAVVALLGLAGAALAGLRRHPLFSFAVLWFLAGHLLESTVFPLELYFEHRNYLPMFGILFTLVVLVIRAPARWRDGALLAACTWITLAAVLTAVQAPVWGDRGKLSTIWALEHPGSARAVQQYADHLARSGRSRIAGDVLLCAHRRGVMGGAFPLQALALACRSRDTGLGGRAKAGLTSLATDPYETSMLDAVTATRRHAQQDACPKLLDESGWLEVTDRLLGNPHYRAGEAQAYLRIERAYLFRNRGNLGDTMREFESAWAVHPTPGLAHLIAATLASAGLYDDAATWARRGLDHAPTGLRGLLSDDEEQTRRLLDALQQMDARR